MSVTYTTARSNARSPTHSVGPGIEPTSSWIRVGFLSTEPHRELPDSFSFLPMSFFCSVIHPGQWISHHVILGSSWLWKFLCLFLFLLVVLRRLGQVFCRMSLTGICLMFLLMMRPGCGFLGGRQEWWSLFAAHHSEGRDPHQELSASVRATSSPGWGSARQVTPLSSYPLSSVPNFRKEVTMHSTRLKGRGLFSSPRGQCGRKDCWEFFSMGEPSRLWFGFYEAVVAVAAPQWLSASSCGGWTSTLNILKLPWAK